MPRSIYPLLYQPKSKNLDSIQISFPFKSTINKIWFKSAHNRNLNNNSYIFYEKRIFPHFFFLFFIFPIEVNNGLTQTFTYWNNLFFIYEIVWLIVIYIWKYDITISAAFLIKSLAVSDHMAGTVSTHFVFSSNVTFFASIRFFMWSCKAWIDKEKTSTAGIGLPFISSRTMLKEIS